MHTNLPTHEVIQDAAEEIERCIWRAEETKGKKQAQHLQELDSEVVSIMAGLDHAQRLSTMHHILSHLESQQGMPAELIEEIFEHSQVSRVEMDAWRLAQATASTASNPSHRRI